MRLKGLLLAASTASAIVLSDPKWARNGLSPIQFFTTGLADPPSSMLFQVTVESAS